MINHPANSLVVCGDIALVGLSIFAVAAAIWLVSEVLEARHNRRLDRRTDAVIKARFKQIAANYNNQKGDQP